MVVKVCKTCGKVLRPTDVFCVNCGTRVPQEPVPQPTPKPKADKQVAFCPECGNRIRPKWLFCMECGTRIKGSQSQGSDVAAQRPGNAERQTQPDWMGRQAAIPVTTPSTPYPYASDRQRQTQTTVSGGMGGNDFSRDVHRDTVTIDSALGNGATSSSLFPDDFGMGARPNERSGMQPPITTRTMTIDDLRMGGVVQTQDVDDTSLGSWTDSFGEWERTDAGFLVDEAPTTVYDEEEEGEDALTMVYAEEEPQPVCKFTRTSTGNVLDLDSLPVTLGRGSAADIRISGNPYIGRVHMRVLERDSEFYIEDLRSSNHTYLNGRQLTPESPTAIHDGDTVALAKEEFTVSIS